MTSLETALGGANNSTTVASFGGDVCIEIRGTWGSATAKVYYSSDGGTTFTPLAAGFSLTTGEAVEAAVTEDMCFIIDIPKGHWRITTSGGTGTSLVVNYAKAVNSQWEQV